MHADSLHKFQTKIDKLFPDRDLKILNYTNMRTPCTIECPVHGVQENINPQSLVNSVYGCRQCGLEARDKFSSKKGTFKNPNQLTDDQYLEAFKEVHHDHYTYNMKRDDKYRITLICPIHGETKVLPSHILKMGRGCTSCNKTKDPEKQALNLKALEEAAASRERLKTLSPHERRLELAKSKLLK